MKVTPSLSSGGGLEHGVGEELCVLKPLLEGGLHIREEGTLRDAGAEDAGVDHAVGVVREGLDLGRPRGRLLGDRDSAIELSNRVLDGGALMRELRGPAFNVLDLVGELVALIVELGVHGGEGLGEGKHSVLASSRNAGSSGGGELVMHLVDGGEGLGFVGSGVLGHEEGVVGVQLLAHVRKAVHEIRGLVVSQIVSRRCRALARSLRRGHRRELRGEDGDGLGGLVNGLLEHGAERASDSFWLGGRWLQQARSPGGRRSHRWSLQRMGCSGREAWLGGEEPGERALRTAGGAPSRMQQKGRAVLAGEPGSRYM